MTDQLIAKLEAAEAGSRELSDEVLLACGWRIIEREMEAPATALAEVWFSPDGIEADEPPSPTESVDDALGLMPEGAYWRLQRRSDGFFATLAFTNSRAATVPLSLCAAILRAYVQEK